MQPLNLSIDICSLFGGALCPLPIYNFTGSDSISLPNTLNVASHIPGIAYVVPDLEAFAQLTLTDVESGEVKACVQSTLSNGWTTHRYAVEWSSGSIVILSLFVAIVYSVLSTPFALPAVRLLDLIYLLQSIASTGLLALNIPVLYRSFTLNFAWALGLFAASSDSAFQRSITNTRLHTGGSAAASSDDGAISFVNRRLSPYNAPIFAASSALLTKAATLPRVDLADLAAGYVPTAFIADSPGPVSFVGGDVATVTQSSDNVLQAGIPIYTNSIGISTANAFMSVFLVALIYAAIVLASLGLGYAVSVLLSRSALAERRPRINQFRDDYASFARAWGLRAALFASFPILIFIFYQWTLKDSWLSVFLSVLLFIALIAVVVPPVVFALGFRLPFVPRPSPSSLAPFTTCYRPERQFYIIPLVLAMLVKALVTSFGHAHGMTQAIVFVVVELLLFGALVTLKPHETRGADVLGGYLCITRLVTSGLLIAFAESLAVKPIPRVAIGAIAAVIFSVAVIVMFVNTLVHIFALLSGRWRRSGEDARTLASSASSDAEKGTSKDALEKEPEAERDNSTVRTAPSAYLYNLRRPTNPSPPTTAASSMFSPPLSASTSTTLGEPLPRRWSFQMSRPPSAGEWSEAGNSPSQSSPSSASHYPRGSRRISSAVPSPIDEDRAWPEGAHAP